MTTIESNKLIAIFMGMEYREGIFTEPHYNVRSENSELTGKYLQSMLKYHESWEWLMPVVENIESLGYVSTIEKLNFEFDSHRVYFNKQGSLEEVSRGARDESKFVAIYMAVEDFIVWYNKNKN